MNFEEPQEFGQNLNVNYLIFKHIFRVGIKLLKISERSKTKYSERSTLSSESVSHSVMSDSFDPCTVDDQAPLSMGFSRQEYWSGLPFPSPGESSWPRDWTRVSCITGRFFTVSAISSIVICKGISRRISIQNRTRKFYCCQCPSVPVSLLPKTCASSPSIYSASILF